MSASLKIVGVMLAVWSSAPTTGYAQAEVEAEPWDPALIEAEIGEQNRQLRELQAKFKGLFDKGVSLFGKNKGDIETTGAPLSGKAPEDYKVGDWGRPASQLAVFTVVQKVEEGALLIVSKRGTWFWLQGVETSKAAEDMQFMLPRVVLISGTKTYQTAVAGAKTVLIMEGDEDKVLHEIEAVRQRDEEEGWHVWTITKQVKRTAGKSAPNIVGPKPSKTPRETKQTYTIVAKLVEAKGGKVSLLNRSAYLGDGRYGEKLETVTLKELSEADREYIREQGQGSVTKAKSDPERSTVPDSKEPAAEVLGTWLDETVGLRRRLTLLRRQGKFFVANKYKDNSGGETEVTETKAPAEGKRFDYKKAPGRSQGGYFFINDNGDLEEWVRFNPDDLIPSSVETKGDYGLYCRAKKAG